MAIYISVKLKDGRTFDVPRPDEEGSSRDKFVLGAYAYTKRKYPQWSSMVITVVNDTIQLEEQGDE